MDILMHKLMLSSCGFVLRAIFCVKVTPPSPDGSVCYVGPARIANHPAGNMDEIQRTIRGLQRL